MFFRHKLLFVPATFALIFSGCQLSDNAQKSAENSGLAADNSSKLLDLSNNAFGDGRQGGARDRREKALEVMYNSKRLTSKLTAAAAYFNALEYQLYKADGFREDNEEKRNRLIADAVSETLRTFHDYVQVDWSNAEQTKSLNDYFGQLTQASYAGQAMATSPLNAFAFAGSMHKISERQMEAAKRYKFNPKSMLDIFSDILIAKKSAESDPSRLAQLPAYVYEGLKMTDEKTKELLITQMLELRMNLMMVSAAGNLVGSVSATKEGTVTVNANAVQLQDAIDKLKAALQVKSILGKADLQARTFGDAKGGLAKFVADSNTLLNTAKDAEAAPLLGKVLEAREIADLLTQ